MGNRQTLGKMGEEVAANYLQKQGYQILDRNYRCSFGEIDIIARENNELVFIEVKTRTSIEFGLPQESVTKKKQLRIRKIAIHYLNNIHPGFSELRFDVVSILIQGNKAPKIEIIKNAF